MDGDSTVDLNRAEQAVSSLLPSDDQQQRYQPKTLKQHNSTRCVYLPMFPTTSFGPKNYLLLANVPGSSFDKDIYHFFFFLFIVV
jgi:hypothetical protein